jgi:arginine decarboxylase
LLIHITHGTGSGNTRLAAFDAALRNAGVSDFNLLYLSSVIPPDSILRIHEQGIPEGTVPGEWGDRLYVVKADSRVSTPGVEAWAGVGWVQEKSSGKGLFVEHEGHDEQSVRRDIENSMNDLMKTRGVSFGPLHMQVAGRRCIDAPVCAVVLSVYPAEPWERRSPESRAITRPRSATQEDTPAEGMGLAR